MLSRLISELNGCPPSQDMIGPAAPRLFVALSWALGGVEIIVGTQKALTEGREEGNFRGPPQRGAAGALCQGLAPLGALCPCSVPQLGANWDPPVLPRQGRGEQGGAVGSWGEEGSQREMEMGSRRTWASVRGRSTSVHPEVSPNRPQHPSPHRPQHPSALQCPQPRQGAAPCRSPSVSPNQHKCPQHRWDHPQPCHQASRCLRCRHGAWLCFQQAQAGQGGGSPGPPTCALRPLSPRQSTTNTPICRSARLGMIKRNSWNNFSHPHIPARRGRGSAAGRGAVRQDEPSLLAVPCSPR